MERHYIALLAAAASIGFFHTIFGPDHYVPFIVMSKARRWSLAKTLTVTFACGMGHVLSSTVLGFIGIALGVAVFKLEALESARVDIAAWALLVFGFTYGVWGVWRALRNRPHQHLHPHPDGAVHSHSHRHRDEHAHVHAAGQAANTTPWILFTIFVFGPCEPLIPLLMYPAAKGNLGNAFIVAAFFSAVTVSTMLAMVCIFSFGLQRLRFAKLERYSHAIAGLTIFLCGGAIKFLGF